VILSDLGPSNPGMDLMRVDFDGTERWRFNVVNAHHDFELVDDDTFLVPVADPREVEVDGVQAFMAADQLVEVRSDGSQREIWNAWDHLTPTAEDLPDMEIPGTIAWLWTHANYLRYVPETDSVQLILRNVDYITEIDRESGDQAWTISAATGAGTALSNPHSVWTTDAGLMVFNQRDFAAEECSGASLLVVDQPTGTVEERWSYESEQCLSVYYTGNAQPLAANRALVAFGSSSMVDEVDMATGQLHWRLSFASGWWLLYTERVEALGPPSP
jgi:outer membrane protein assembly factor BamB